MRWSFIGNWILDKCFCCLRINLSVVVSTVNFVSGGWWFECKSSHTHYDNQSLLLEVPTHNLKRLFLWRYGTCWPTTSTNHVSSDFSHVLLEELCGQGIFISYFLICWYIQEHGIHVHKDKVFLTLLNTKRNGWNLNLRWGTLYYDTKRENWDLNGEGGTYVHINIQKLC